MKSNRQGEFPNTDQKVWINENFMTNIISFFKIAKAEGMHVTHDNNQEDAFVIHHPKTGTMKLLPSQQGIYQHDTAAKCLVNTVANNEEGHSQRQLQQAQKARDLCEMVVCPSTNDFKGLDD